MTISPQVYGKLIRKSWGTRAIRRARNFTGTVLKRSAVQRDGAAMGSDVAGQQVDQRGFAAAVRADNAVKMAPFEGQRQVCDNGFGAVGKPDVFQFVHYDPPPTCCIWRLR